MISGIVTTVLLVLFLAGWIWAWSPKRKREFDAAATADRHRVAAVGAPSFSVSTQAPRWSGARGSTTCIAPPTPTEVRKVSGRSPKSLPSTPTR